MNASRIIHLTRAREVDISEASLEAMPQPWLADVCHLLGRSNKGTPEELISRIRQEIQLASDEQQRVVPICLSSPTDVVPESYVILERTTTCRCGAKHSTFETFARERLKTRDPRNPSRFIQHLVPVEKFVWNVPIEQRPISATSIAACPSCVTGLETWVRFLPKPPKPQVVVAAAQVTEAGEAPTRSNTQSLSDMLDNI